MTTLSAQANQAWREVTADEPTDDNAGFGHQRAAWEDGWETGYKTARSETAEALATVAEEFADDLEPPTTVEWLELRDWFKDQLHQVAAHARLIGGSAS